MHCFSCGRQLKSKRRVLQQARPPSCFGHVCGNACSSSWRSIQPGKCLFVCMGYAIVHRQMFFLGQFVSCTTAEMTKFGGRHGFVLGIVNIRHLSTPRLEVSWRDRWFTKHMLPSTYLLTNAWHNSCSSCIQLA